MGYSKAETMNKQRKLVSKAQRNKRKVLVNLFKVVLVLIITLVIAAAGACFGMVKGILDNAPDINTINVVPKGYKTYIYDQDGNITREISTVGSNREYVYLEEIPKNLQNAFIAIEDERFWSHNGIDVKGIFRVAIRGLSSGEFDQGASTITQQLIKNAVFNVGLDETTFLDKLERKVQEQYLALELEKKYTKEQILELYLNTIYLGRSANGVQAASKKYFGKTIDQLTLSECAAIAGITKNPSAFDPVEFPQESAKRREDVLDKMLELEFITQAQYDEAMADNVYERIANVAKIERETPSVYSYYEDAILDELIKDFQEIYDCTEEEAGLMIYSGGYSVYSVQDMRIQNICDEVINDDSYVESAKVGLDYRLTIVDKNKEEHNYSMENMISYFKVTTGNPKYNNIYDNEAAARTAANEYKEHVLDETGGTMIAESFSVSPQPQFAFTIMDQKTGYVKALVGGKGEKKVDRGLNRATNSPRQPGSTFKIVAAYFPLYETDKGGLATSIEDEEYRFADGQLVHNWWGYSSYRGFNTTRKAMADSMNVLAVKTIDMVGPQVAFDYVKSLGFTTLADGTTVGSDGTVLTDVTQSLALGGLTYGVTTSELCAAYAAIANGGVYTKPVLYSKVVDHEGNVIIDNTIPENRQRRVMRDTTAWQLIEGMRSVVNEGTGGSARMTTGIDCGGKTGTTSSGYDLWFSGISAYYTATIWTGYDYNTSMKGGSTHQRMWRDIMDKIAIEEEQSRTATIMDRPAGIVSVELCQITNLLPEEGCPTARDYMASTAVPSERCGGHEFVEFCMDSKKVATENCPNKQKFTIQIKENKTTHEEEKIILGMPKDDPFEYTEEICELHPATSLINVTTEAGAGGTISGSVQVEQGSSVTVYITPSAGYTVSDVFLNGISVGATTSYTIPDITADVKISATFRKVGGQTTPQTPPSTTETPPSTTEAPPSTTEAPPSTTEAPVTPSE